MLKILKCETFDRSTVVEDTTQKPNIKGLNPASGKWRVASGKWQVASGKWQVASGKCQVATEVSKGHNRLYLNVF